MEHYEITRYRSLRRWAKMLALPDAVDLLSQTLEEESRTDKLLTKIAKTEVNAKVAALRK